MGAIKITGEGLVIVGKIMKAEGVEEFLKGFGEDLLTKYSPQSLKWFRPEARAVDALSSEVETAIRDKGLRSLVQQTLSRYPQIIGQIAVSTDGIPTPKGNIYLRLVPRYLVNQAALKEIAKPLDKAARLQELKGGSEARQIFFRQLVSELDEAYTNSGVSVARPLPAGTGKVIVHYDPDFNWMPQSNDRELIGAYVVYWNDEAALKKNRKEVKEKLDQFVTELAALSREDIDTIRKNLKPPSSYSF